MAEAVFYSAHDLFSSAHAVYEPIIAGRMLFNLINGKLGIPTDRWFALDVAVHSAAEDRYHYLNARLVAAMARRCGVGIAKPEYLNPGEVKPILDWISEKEMRGRIAAFKRLSATRSGFRGQLWRRGCLCKARRSPPVVSP